MREVLNPPPVNFSAERGTWGSPSRAGTFELTKRHSVVSKRGFSSNLERMVRAQMKWSGVSSVSVDQLLTLASIPPGGLEGV